MRYEFTLHYKGPLYSNGNSKHKHELRRHFHQQLQKYIEPSEKKIMIEAMESYCLVQRDKYRFIPLISDDIHMAGQIDVFLLKPGPRGSIVTQGGDIDNRLKTLLDSLKVPESNAIPKGFEPEEDENPFYCVLKDDSLITKLTVNTDQLLEETADPTDVILFLKIIGEETESFSFTPK